MSSFRRVHTIVASTLLAGVCLAGSAQDAVPPSIPPLPTTPGAFRTTDCGVLPDATGPDGFVAKVNAQGTALLYSTYLCGNAYDSVNAIAVDGSNNVWYADLSGWLGRLDTSRARAR